MHKAKVILVTTLLLIWQAVAANSTYALMKMDDNGIKDALQYGNTHKLEEIVNSPEWTIKAKDFTEVTLMSAYNMVAVMAAKAKMDSKELTFNEAKDMFKVAENGTSILDFFPFYCMVYGPTPDYLKEFTFELRQGKNVIKPGDIEMEEPTLHTKGERNLYFTNYRLYFKIVSIDIKSPLKFVVINPMGKTTEYEFDLANMR